NHFLRSECCWSRAIAASIASPLAVLTCDPTADTFKTQVLPFLRQASALHSGHAEALRPVLPDRTRARAGRRALVAPRRARAAARPARLHGPVREPAEDRHEHPRLAAEGSGGLRDRGQAPAASAGRVAGLRADAVRPGAEAADARAGRVGPALARPARP